MAVKDQSQRDETGMDESALIQYIRDPSSIDAKDLPQMLGEVERPRAELWSALYAAATKRATTPSSDVGFFTVAEVAKKLKFSRGHVYELVRQGRLRVIRTGRSVRVPVAALSELGAMGTAKAVDVAAASSGRWRAGGRTGVTGVTSEAGTCEPSALPRRGQRRK